MHLTLKRDDNDFKVYLRFHSISCESEANWVPGLPQPIGDTIWGSGFDGEGEHVSLILEALNPPVSCLTTLRARSFREVLIFGHFFFLESSL